MDVPLFPSLEEKDAPSDGFSASFLELFRREDLRPLLTSALLSFSVSLFELPRVRSLSRIRDGIPSGRRIRVSVLGARQRGRAIRRGVLDAYQHHQNVQDDIRSCEGMNHCSEKSIEVVGV